MPTSFSDPTPITSSLLIQTVPIPPHSPYSIVNHSQMSITSNTISVQGPLPPDEGFIPELLRQTNDLDCVRVTAGDVVRLLPESSYSPGYTIAHLTILPSNSEDPGSDNELTHNLDEHANTDNPISQTGEIPPQFPLPSTVLKKGRWADLILQPNPSTPRPSPDTRIAVHCLEAIENYNPFTFSVSPTDKHARYISYDPATGIITLRVSLRMLSGDSIDEQSWIYLEDSWNIEGISSPFLQDVWDYFQTLRVKEGVSFADTIIPSDLADRLNHQISHVAASEPVDYHPGSNDCVRDIVHPSLFPFIHGESVLTETGTSVVKAIREYNDSMKAEESIDRWGRKFEPSKYQWLPSIFRVGEDGKTSIESYINNLDRKKYPDLYQSLAQLFDIFLPHFEQVYAYLQELQILPEHEEDMESVEHDYNPDLEGAKLSGKSLRVITKIIDYELSSDEDCVDGVFHVEGMSSEHIIMTGLYIASRDEDFEGGELMFRRAFQTYEGWGISSEIAQCRHWRAEQIIEDNMYPLGTLDTPCGRIIVFPNSHVHQLSKMTRRSHSNGDDGSNVRRAQTSRRRIVVFWVVDPERDVVTTEDVAPQQGVMLLETAKEHRLKLMEERKRHKGKLNGLRKISLCEH